MPTKQRTRTELIMFLVTTFALSSVFYVLIISAGTLGAGSGLYVLGLMWSPGVAALITTLWSQGNLKGLGWGWGKTRYQITSYGLPIVVAGLVYGVVWLTGLGGIDTSFRPNIVRFLLLGTLLNCVFALGEEIGWRGFLVSRLARVTSFTTHSLIVGLIWAVWHYPLLLFADYNAGTSAAFGLTSFTLQVVGMSFLYGWMRLKSGSVWTAMFLHGSWNMYVQGLFDPLTTDTGITRYVVGEFGLALSIASVAVAFVVWKLRDRLPAIARAT